MPAPIHLQTLQTLRRLIAKADPAALAALAIPALLLGAAFANLHTGKAQNAPVTKAEAPVQQKTLAQTPAPPLPDMAALEQAAFADLNQSSLAHIHDREIRIRPGATLSKVLEKAGVERGEAARAIQALAKTYDPRQLRAGQTLALALRDSTAQTGAGKGRYHLAGLSTRPDVTRTIVLERGHDGGFSAHELVMDLQAGLARARGSIDSSLYIDALNAGASDAVIANFAQLYAYSVDFQRSIRPGDRFDMVFEDYRDDEGKIIKTGNLVYAMLAPRGREMAYYRFESKDGDVGYYDAKGHSAKRFLMKTPVKGARISSGFGRRFHPILGYTRMHKGVDFAARRGTPVMAAGNGVIERASRYGSYGNYIRIRHANGFKTAYAHLSRYRKGIRKGRHVTQGQIIGYVGATGRATGPHLHYEVLRHNHQVNPMTIKVPTGRRLGADELKRFAIEKARIDKLIETARPAAAEPRQVATTG